MSLLMHILCFVYLEKVTKYCDETGNWFRHPETNRTWSNYTLCIAHTKDKLKVWGRVIQERSIVLWIFRNRFWMLSNVMKINLCEFIANTTLTFVIELLYFGRELNSKMAEETFLVAYIKITVSIFISQKKPAGEIITRIGQTCLKLRSCFKHDTYS